jgi:TM2 domain-containing membrane protein YozV
MESNNEQLNWYYEKDGKQTGPVSTGEIEAQIEAGILSYGSKVWQEGTSVWVSLENSRFKHLLTYPPPLDDVLKKRAVYIILGLFLGGWGVHNFYAGYVGRGIAQLLIVLLAGWRFYPLALIVGAWVLIEICTVTQDAKGKSFS